MGSFINEETAINLDQTVEIAALKAIPLFNMYGWVWAGAKAESGVPTRQEIENKYRELIDDLLKYDTRSIGTGRLTVVRTDSDDEDFIALELGLDLANGYIDKKDLQPITA